MAKTEDEKLKEKLDEITRLLKEKADIDTRLKELTGIRNPKENSVSKPDGFVLTYAIKEVLGITNSSMSIKELQTFIGNRYSYFPEPKSILSTAKYLVNQGRLVFDKNKKTYTLLNDKNHQPQHSAKSADINTKNIPF